MLNTLFVGDKETRPMFRDTAEWFERTCKESYQNAVQLEVLSNIPFIMGDSFFLAK